MERTSPNPASVTKTCVIYAFAYVGKTAERGMRSEAMKRQLELAKRYATKHGYDAATIFVATRTSRRGHFADTPEFRRAIANAQAVGGPIIVADLEGLLTSTNSDRTREALHAVLAAEVDVIDAHSQASVHAFDVGRIASRARVTAARKRMAIKRGLPPPGTRKPPPPNNLRRATKASELKADTFARQLQGIVAEIREAQVPGSPVTASMLKNELNRRGVLSSGGKEWSAASAKNLLARIDRLFPDQSSP